MDKIEKCAIRFFLLHRTVRWLVAVGLFHNVTVMYRFMSCDCV
jgi:hypothetical protein